MYNIFLLKDQNSLQKNGRKFGAFPVGSGGLGHTRDTKVCDTRNMALKLQVRTENAFDRFKAALYTHKTHTTHTYAFCLARTQADKVFSTGSDHPRKGCGQLTFLLTNQP